MVMNLSTTPLISVVIATFHRADYLEKCLKSILSNSYNNYEIIIVDQGRDGKTKKLVNEQFINNKKTKYIHTDIIGLSHARNIGFENAKGEIIAFIDDDAVAAKDWLRAYANAFTEIKPAPGIVGGKLIPEWEIPFPSWYPEERIHLLSLYDIGDESRKYPEGHLPPGANFAVSRDVIEKIGGFDRRLGFDEKRNNPLIAGEESLFAFKAKEEGYSIYYFPEAQVNHYVAKYKLTKKFFFKRNFSEGVTIVKAKDCYSSVSKKQLKKMFFGHLKSIFKNVYALVKTFYKTNSNTSSRRMLYLSLLSSSLGVCVESVKLLLKKDTSNLLNKSILT